MNIQDLSEVFETAISIEDVAQRQEYILSAIPDDMHARKKLIRLVASHDKECAILDTSSAIDGLAIWSEDDLCPVQQGDQLGNYRVQQRIGEGGMGFVFLADQLSPIQRRVAIKVLKPSLAAGSAVKRFQAERLALSRSDHPGITRILDAGLTESGVPFFVMEWVQGKALAEYCDLKKLSIKKRVELVERVCWAVHHAHQQGIIHRDIKPSNILVAEHGEIITPKVIDFGIAKVLGATQIDVNLTTKVGDVIGTPQYMSPEQAENGGSELDVRTDVYSIGAVLYELLTGSPPIPLGAIDGVGLLRVLETVRDHVIENPSTRSYRNALADPSLAVCRNTRTRVLPRLLRGELDWILLKALAQKREERYESAASMAHDLRRFLDGKAVDAAAPSSVYKIRKLFNRHRRKALSAACGLIILMCIALASIGWGVANDRLRQLAADRASELSQKSQRLEEASGRLRSAKKRAFTAELNLLTLQASKKEQIAWSRANHRYLLKGFTKIMRDDSRMIVEKVSIPGGADLEAAATDSKELEDVIRRAIAHAIAQAIPSDDMPPADSEANPSKHVKTDHDVSVRNPHSAGIRRSHHPDSTNVVLLPDINNDYSHPNLFARLLVDEFRREFGDHNPRVAGALVLSCRVGIENRQLPPNVIESRLREALSLLSSCTELIMVTARIETHLILAGLLAKENRHVEANQLFVESQMQLSAVRDRLPDETIVAIQTQMKELRLKTE